MTVDDSLLAQGILAARAGEKGKARRLLTQVIQEEPRSEAAWLWLSSVLETPQGRAHCLRQVLALNPRNQTAQKGLAALEEVPPAPAIVARVPPAVGTRDPAPVAAAPAEPVPAWRGLVGSPRFWQFILIGLAAVATVLVGFLLYAVLVGGAPPEEEPVAMAMPSPTPWPRGTLRPTYTATATKAPTPTFVPTFTPIPTHTPTPLPTATCTPTETATPAPTTRARRRSPTATPPPTATACPPPPVRTLDGRLTLLGVQVAPASVPPGQPYWRLVDAQWEDGEQSEGKHSIYVEVLDAAGNRALGQRVVVEWAGGSARLVVKDVPPPEFSVNFPMYNTLGSYSVRVFDLPSDRVTGLGLGTIEAPNFTVHTCFYLTFRLANR